MPSRNEEKVYLPDTFYHLYNRGVEKRVIYQDNEDYNVFLSYLKTYLLPKPEEDLRNRLANPSISDVERKKIVRLLQMNNFHGKLTLHAYCLMPNHFHLLVHQTDDETIAKFMNSFITRYGMYFNRKYKRVGPLFQGIYKAIPVTTDEQLLHLSRYIHVQAILDDNGRLSAKPHPSSWLNYIGSNVQDWLKTETLLGYFQSKKSKSGVDAYKEYIISIDREADESVSSITLE